MGIPAQNSLLKVFEEPPEYCTIILIVKNANSLLQTIRSRAMLVRISPLAREQVEKYMSGAWWNNDPVIAARNIHISWGDIQNDG